MTTPGIGDTRTLPTTQINLFHKNPRRGDVEAIAGSLQAHGQFRPIVVNEGTHTGRPMETLAGNHTLKAIRLLAERNPDDPRWQQVECYVVDVDEDRASRIVLADNRTADLGSYDNDILIDVLNSVEHDLDGTGYDYDDLSALLDMAAGPDSLDELEEQFGELEDDDFWITVRLRIPPVLNEQWKDWANAYDSPEEAFEALLDKGGDYGQA